MNWFVYIFVILQSMGCHPQNEGCAGIWLEKLAEIKSESAYIVMFNHSSTLINSPRSIFLQQLIDNTDSIRIYSQPDRGPLMVADLKSLRKWLKMNAKLSVIKLLKRTDQDVVHKEYDEAGKEKDLMVGYFNETSYRLIEKGK